MELNTKEVYYHEYCHRCKNEKKDENEWPCDICMTPYNSYQYGSHKPSMYSPKETK